MQNLIKYLGFLSIKNFYITFFLIFLVACGNKGPLTLPDTKPSESSMEQSSDMNAEQ